MLVAFASLWATAQGPLRPASEIYSSNPGSPWPAADGLGRSLPDAHQSGPPRPHRFVGIFYFLWLGQHDRTDQGPFVVSDILQRFPNALSTSASPPWGPESSPHFWGEPLYGFYLNSDPWVLRRHAQLLSDAGVDTLIFDATNRNTYREVYMALCAVFRQIRQEGERTPQIAFMVNTEAGDTAQEIYEDLYKRGLYEDLWFRWNGKPLMLCDPEKASPEVRSFFTLRRAHWPFTQVNTPYAWHWEAAYPQVYGYTDDDRAPEQVNVSVAQNLRQSDGVVTMMSNGDARGRSFHDGALDTGRHAVDYGYNFQEQWSRALALDPPFAMVTGWNEWIAGRFARPGQGVIFVDQFNEEFSRDIEMMRGGHQDNYYYQLVSNIRRYKGAPQLRTASGPKEIDVAGGFYQWRDVRPEYRAPSGLTTARDYDGVGRMHYTNRTGRNDLELMKVARDAKNVYFYARTRGPVTPWNGQNWMMLLIRTGTANHAGWEGYDFIVNRKVVNNQTTLLEKSEGGWNWSKAATVPYQVKGNELQVAIPRSALGFANDPADLSFDFKWVDNSQKPGDLMDFYLSGSAAPEGRFRYRYLTKAESGKPSR